MLGLFRVSVTVGSSVVEWLACWTQAQKGPGSVLGKQPLPLSPSSKIGSSPLKGCGGNWRKVMAAYRRVYDSRYLQADCQEPGSARNPTRGNRVWATFTF